VLADESKEPADFLVGSSSKQLSLREGIAHHARTHVKCCEADGVERIADYCTENDIVGRFVSGPQCRNNRSFRRCEVMLAPDSQREHAENGQCDNALEAGRVWARLGAPYVVEKYLASAYSLLFCSSYISAKENRDDDAGASGVVTGGRFAARLQSHIRHRIKKE
jgi:hypothetical protein